MKSLIVLSLTLSSFAFERTSRACQCEPSQGTFVMGFGVLPSDAHGDVWLIPSDARGVVWWSGFGSIEGIVTERQAETDVWQQHPHSIESLDDKVHLVIPSGLRVGDRYRFTKVGAKAEGDAIHRIEVEVSPIALGPLLAKSQLVVNPRPRKTLKLAVGAKCSDSFAVDARAVQFELPPEAQPFLHALMYTTRVDDAPWRPRGDICQPVPSGRSWMRWPGADVVLIQCGGRPDAWRTLASSKHKVAISANLPGTPIAFEISGTVELSCQ